LDTKPEIKLTFTTAERNQIRDALSRYSKERSIGSTILQKEICRHDPRGREVHEKTLQRFLGKTNNTQDHNLSVCYEFAKELPYFGERRRAAALGQALSRFYDPGAAREADGPWSLKERIVLEARRFDLRDASSGISVVPRGLTNDDFPVHGVVILDPSDDEEYYRIYQILTGASGSAQASSSPRLLSEGVAVPIEDHSMVTVEMDVLTHRPRNGLWLYDKSYDWSAKARYLLPQVPRARSDPLHREDSLSLTCKPGGEDIAALADKFLEVDP